MLLRYVRYPSLVIRVFLAPSCKRIGYGSNLIIKEAVAIIVYDFAPVCMA